MTTQVLVVHLSGPIKRVEDGLRRCHCSSTVLSLPAATSRSPFAQIEQMPDVVVLCAQDCGEDLAHWVQSLRKRFRNAPLLFVGVSDPASIRDGVCAGLAGHIEPERCDMLGRALEAVKAGEAWLPRRLVSDIIRHWRQPYAPPGDRRRPVTTH